jgi:hypothetical protein
LFKPKTKEEDVLWAEQYGPPTTGTKLVGSATWASAQGMVTLAPDAVQSCYSFGEGKYYVSLGGGKGELVLLGSAEVNLSQGRMEHEGSV